MNKIAILAIGAILTGVIASAGLAGWLFTLLPEGHFYTQIDNTKTEELESRGGVIDFTGGMKMSYTLSSYDEQGNERDISFGTERQLREDAFLELDVAPIRGVMGWREVSFEDLPAAVQERIQED